MSRRLKVLISAYACEPHKGSEPEVGWQWSLQMARFHDVTVLTRTANRENVEQEIAALRGARPLPRFVYHDEDKFLLNIKRRFRATRLYYVLWQRSAHRIVARLLQEQQFDLLHHVTFATYRYTTAVWHDNIPCIWGPIGGIESIPFELLPWRSPRALASEVLRNFDNLLQSATFTVMRGRAARSKRILVSTPQMQRTFAEYGITTRLMPAIGLDPTTFEPPKGNLRSGPLRILYVGNIIPLKGIDLALHALRESQTNARFTLVGSGSFQGQALKLSRRLGLGERVEFRGRLPHRETLEVYRDFDVLMFPSLHDTGGYAMVEAMANKLPVICLDTGGPEVAVREGCGVRVPLGSRRSVIRGLADAVRRYDQDRSLLLEHGNRAREVVLEFYDWNRKGEQMNEIYLDACSSGARRRKVLVSAYACEPDKGSEPEAGWRWATKLPQFCDVTVVTRSNNRSDLERALSSHDKLAPELMFYDLPDWLIGWKKNWDLPVQLYYVLWQAGVRWDLRRKLSNFDLIHHVTFNSFRWPGFWWGCKRPVLLGPLGGGQICPWRFLPLFGWRLPIEAMRSILVMTSRLNPIHQLNCRAATRLIVANRDTLKRIPLSCRAKVRMMLDAGIETSRVPPPVSVKGKSGNRIIWAGRLDKRKAAVLALRAFARARRSNPKLHLTIAGTGPEMRSLRHMSDRSGISDAITWGGAVPHATLQSWFVEHDIFLFTSLRDTSGYVILEAMAASLPVVTLLHQGAAEMTTDETAIRIPMISISETERQLSDAILKLSGSPDLREQLGAAGRERVCDDYLWDQKAKRMRTFYEEILGDIT